VENDFIPFLVFIGPIVALSAGSIIRILSGKSVFRKQPRYQKPPGYSRI